MTTSNEKVGQGPAVPEEPPAAKPSEAIPGVSMGPVAAALLAAGVGAAALGLLTTLAEASKSVKDWLSFSDAVGPLSGKTIVAVAVWLVAWLVLHVTMRRARLTRLVLGVTAVLLVAGLLGTFPVFFQAFG